jgi:S1-C subfamily serine protease
VLLALAAGAYIVGALLASSGSPGSTAAPGVPGSPGAPTATGPTGPMRWLGMEVETVNPGGVVVATVPPGSAGEQAGLDPGDIIVQVNNRTVNATGDITKAIAGLPAGQQVPLEASRGSTRYTTTVTLGAAPGHYP